MAPGSRPGFVRRLLIWVFRGRTAGRPEGPPPTQVPQPCDTSHLHPKQATSALTGRHRAVRDWWIGRGQDKPKDVVGLALSGGGIRSATFSLGVAQAFARREAFGTIDVLSTVSGGSYIGCFLRSLYLPQHLRGIKQSTDNDTPDAPDPDHLDEQRRFADAALVSAAGVKQIPGPGGIGMVCNPIWWLREHSRYLAPNGPSDFSYAAAYLARNWIAMIWVFSIAVSIPLVVSAGIEAGIGGPRVNWAWAQITRSPPRIRVADTDNAAVPTVGCEIRTATANGRADITCSPVSTATPVPFQPWSPLLLLALFPAIVGLGVSTAYWLTGSMSSNEPNVARQKRNFLRLFAFVALTAGLLSLVNGAPGWLGPNYVWLQMPPLADAAIAVTLVVLLAELVIGAFYFVYVLGHLRYGNRNPREALGLELLTSELRLVLTQHQAWLFNAAAWLAAVGMIETLAVWLRAWVWDRAESGESLTVQLGTLGGLPLVAFVLKKIQDWSRDGKAQGKLLQIVMRILPMVTLAVGVLLYGVVAVAVDAIVIAGTWEGAAWASAPDWTSFCTMAAVLVTLALLTGRSSGFINLSSWHHLYASRLTRAYLGGTNVSRLHSVVADDVADATIRDNHALDYIQPSIYAQTQIPAPLHVINLTVNRTVNPRSQFAARDRRGEPASMEPDGIQLGSGPNTPEAPTFLPWSVMGKLDMAERLSLGQWCAISGAAVSTGMGRRTNTGFALLTSFANIRLGYWWWAPGMMGKDKPSFAALALPTFMYLKNELTARYARAYDRQYLSDGGHFENTGVYPLLKRHVPLVIVSDNGEDADYTFSDLENLVRVVRLDLGLEITLLRGPTLALFMTRVGCEAAGVFVDALAQPDWKAGMKSGTTAGFALAFEVCNAGDVTTHMVLIKPRVVRDAPEDVLGFARANPDFPQQTTGDQFFGEAQWESYRRLGETLTLRLLDTCPRLLPRRP